MDDLSTDAFLSTYLNVKKFQNEQTSRNVKVNTIGAEEKDFHPLLYTKNY